MLLSLSPPQEPQPFQVPHHILPWGVGTAPLTDQVSARSLLVALHLSEITKPFELYLQNPCLEIIVWNLTEDGCVEKSQSPCWTVNNAREVCISVHAFIHTHFYEIICKTQMHLFIFLTSTAMARK